MIVFHIVNFIFAYFRVLIGFLILKDLFDIKCDKDKFYKFIFLLLIPIALSSAFNMQWYFYSNSILIIECILTTFGASFVMIGKKRILFVVTMFYQVSFVMINLFIMYLYCVISSDREVYQFINLASMQRYCFMLVNCLILIIIYCLVHKFLKGNSLKIENYYIVLAWATIAIYFVSAYYQEIYLKPITNIEFYEWLLWFLLFILVITAFLCYVKYRTISENAILAMMRNNLLETSYSEMHNIFQDNAILCHDINKHFLILNKLLEIDKTEEAKDYLKNLNVTITKVSNFIWTDNKFVDMVLNTKLLEAEKLGISIEINADKINFSTNNYDLCLILGNLLDNAIEASSLCEKNRWIHISILRNKDIVNITITNSLSKKPIEKNGKLFTTKKDNRSHGIGLLSVRQLVEKNEGLFNYKFDNNQFEANVTLFNIF